jgi:nucleoside-diphosphate-sugar epimerase
MVTGPFFDWGLNVGFFGFDGSSKTVTIFDDGKTVFSTTNLDQIGTATVKALEKADLTKNQYVYVSGFQTTQTEILAAAEKATGTKWTVKKATVDDTIKEGQAKLQKGDYSGIMQLLQGATFNRQQLGDFSPQGLWNEKLGVPEGSLEETVKAAFA